MTECLTAPIAALPAAEAALVAQAHRASDMLDAVGLDGLPGALARLHASKTDALRRLRDAACFVGDCFGEVLGEVEAITAGLAMALPRQLNCSPAAVEGSASPPTAPALEGPTAHEMKPAGGGTAPASPPTVPAPEGASIRIAQMRDPSPAEQEATEAQKHADEAGEEVGQPTAVGGYTPDDVAGMKADLDSAHAEAAAEESLPAAVDGCIAYLAEQAQAAGLDPAPQPPVKAPGKSKRKK